MTDPRLPKSPSSLRSWADLTQNCGKCILQHCPAAEHGTIVHSNSNIAASLTMPGKGFDEARFHLVGLTNLTSAEHGILQGSRQNHAWWSQWAQCAHRLSQQLVSCKYWLCKNKNLQTSIFHRTQKISFKKQCAQLGNFRIFRLRTCL